METRNESISDMSRKEIISKDQIDIKPLFDAVWRKKWRILILAFVVSLVTNLLVKTIEPTYQATAKIQIEQEEAKVLSIEQIYDIGGSNEFLKTQFELLKSRSLAERVVDDLNLITHPLYDPSNQPEPIIDLNSIISEYNIYNILPGLTPEDFEEKAPPTEEQIKKSIVNQIINNLTITPINKTELVMISFDSNDPTLAKDIANSFAYNFINSKLDAEMEASLTATSWMNNRLVELRKNLQDSELKLQSFKEEQGLIDVGGIVTVSADELSAINNRLVDARAKLAEIRSQYLQVNSINRTDWKKLSSVPAILSNPLVQSFKTEEAKAQSKVDEFSKRYGTKHPFMQTALGELKSAQASLRSQVEQVAASIKRQYQIASANVNSLKNSVKENKIEIQEISKNEYKVKELAREVDYNRQIFDTFMSRYKETTATVDLENSNVRVVDEAIQPSYPIKPNTKLLTILMGLVTAMFAILIVLITHVLNNTFKNTEDVENELNLPVLGILPLVKKMDKVALAFHKNNHKIFSESVRTIRTSVMLSSLESSHKVVMITSSVPSEGKSTTSINLADALNQMEKTILIEADMRRPTLAKIFDLPPGTPGLANLISGTNSLEECTNSLFGGIHTIVAGTVPPNPLELISSSKFTALLEELAEKYDRILIDSPPVNAVSDGLVLSQYADSVIYVVKSNATDKKIVKKGVGKLLQNNAPLRGIILNQVDIKKAKKQGYSYDGYYDYYGYSSSKVASS